MERADTFEQGFYSPVLDVDTNMGVGMSVDIDFFMLENTQDHNTPQYDAPSHSAAPFPLLSHLLQLLLPLLPLLYLLFNKIMANIAQRVGYQQDLSTAKKQVNDALKSLPLTMHDRLKAASLIMKNPQHVELFFSLREDLDEMLASVNMLLAELI
ncbi:hypothetical protein Dimus_031298 [Dionaea muscipula]